MKLYYFKKESGLSDNLPKLWVHCSKPDSVIQVSTIETDDMMINNSSFNITTVDLITTEKNNITAFTTGNIVLDLGLLTEAARGKIKRHDRQVWLGWWKRGHPTLLGPAPIFQMSTGHKFSTKLSPLYFERTEVFSFSSPFADSVFDECFCTVTAPELVLTGDPLELITDHGFTDPDDLREYLLPSISLSSEGMLTPNSPATVTAQVVNADGKLYGGDMEIWFETVNGQISHSRKSTVDGFASIKVIAPMMEKGEVVRVKAGTKFVTGIADISLTVEGD
jgi:hypothetical protein